LGWLSILLSWRPLAQLPE